MIILIRIEDNCRYREESVAIEVCEVLGIEGEVEVIDISCDLDRRI